MKNKINPVFSTKEKKLVEQANKYKEVAKKYEEIAEDSLRLAEKILKQYEREIVIAFLLNALFFTAGILLGVNIK